IFEIKLRNEDADFSTGKVLVFDFSGKLVYSDALSSSEYSMNLGDNLKGMFIVKVVGSNFQYFKKINIQ
ncbi:MAG: hypothetical protein RLZZ292_1644, partial [Bacteroidota bacterium]